MSKKLEEKTEKELLIEIVKNESKTKAYELIAAIAQLIIVAALIILFVIFVPKLSATIETADTTLTDLSRMSVSVERSFEEIDQTIDFEKLNKSIEDLSNVVGPLADAMSIFS